MGSAAKAFKDIDKILRVGGKIIKYDVEPLNAFGENFGSIMLKVDFTIENSQGRRTIYTVAKLMPQDPVIMEIFNTQVTYKSEIKFYSTIIPTIQEFQREQGASIVADYFPKFYGGRTSLNPYTDVVDSGAVILLENLKAEGYSNEDRHTGFDLNTTKLVIDRLVNLQATVSALKIKQPEVFQEKIEPHMTKMGAVAMERGIPDGYFREFEEIGKFKHLVPKFKALYQRALDHKPDVHGLWSSIVHNDFWVNNIMLKHDNNGADIKLLDFQLYEQDSCVKDLLFLLFTSVQISVLKYHFDRLLKYYYDQYIKTLRELKVATSSYTYSSFETELAEHAYQIFHATFMLPAILGPSHKNDNDKPKLLSPPQPKKRESIKRPPYDSNPLLKDKFLAVWEEVVRRNWL